MPKTTVAAPLAKPYERLDAWQSCHELALVIYRATRKWPAEERYGLVSQARRAAVSAAANLAEGTARQGTRELKRFVEIALGSLAEVEYLVTLAGDIGVVDTEEQQLLRGFVDRAGQLTGGLHRALRKRTA